MLCYIAGLPSVWHGYILVELWFELCLLSVIYARDDRSLCRDSPLRIHKMGYLQRFVFLAVGCCLTENRPPFCGNGHSKNELPGNQLFGCLAMPPSVKMNELIGLKKGSKLCLTPNSDLKPLIAIHIKSKWQHRWGGNINKLHDIEPEVWGNTTDSCEGRRNQVVLNLCCLRYLWLLFSSSRGPSLCSVNTNFTKFAGTVILKWSMVVGFVLKMKDKTE